MHDIGIKAAPGCNRGESRMRAQKFDEVCPALMASGVLQKVEEHGWRLGCHELL